MGNQRARFVTARGSANETRAALRLAIQWQLIADTDAAAALELLDRILAMLWKLTNGRTLQEIR